MYSNGMRGSSVDVFKVLSHPLRVEVLRVLAGGDGMRYTDVLEELGVETGKLNFHLRKLDGYVDTEDGEYRLTERGAEALRLAESADAVTRTPATVATASPDPSQPGATPVTRLKALSLDAALFLLTPLASSLFVLFTIPVQLSLSDPATYLLAGMNLREHLVIGTLLMLTGLTVGETVAGRTPGKSLMGIKVTRRGAAPGTGVSLVRALVTVYLLPLDFLAARALKLDELRLTDRLLDVEVVQDTGDDRSGSGGAGRWKRVPATDGTNPLRGVPSEN